MEVYIQGRSDCITLFLLMEVVTQFVSMAAQEEEACWVWYQLMHQAMPADRRLEELDAPL